MRRTFYIILLLIVFIAGCLETKEAWPAVVDGSVLKEQGWVSAGDIQKQSQTETVAGTTIKTSMAIMNYRDDALARNLKEQAAELSSLTPAQKKDASQFTSQLLTVRLVLPAGISIPSGIVNKIISSQLEQLASQNNIRDFHETGSIKTTLASGKEIDVKTYEGSVNFEGGSIKIKGMTASWPDSGSTIIVFGILPKEDIVIKPVQGEAVAIKINGGQESGKIITLIQNVK